MFEFQMSVNHCKLAFTSKCHHTEVSLRQLEWGSQSKISLYRGKVSTRLLIRYCSKASFESLSVNWTLDVTEYANVFLPVCCPIWNMSSTRATFHKEPEGWGWTGPRVCKLSFCRCPIWNLESARATFHNEAQGLRMKRPPEYAKEFQLTQCPIRNVASNSSKSLMGTKDWGWNSFCKTFSANAMSFRKYNLSTTTRAAFHNGAQGLRLKRPPEYAKVSLSMSHLKYGC